MAQRGRPKGYPKTGGRQKATGNKIATEAKEALGLAFAQLGDVRGLVEWGRLNRTPFYGLWGKLVPRDVNANLSGSVAVSLVQALEELDRSKS